jgi:hypothetical protein
MQFRFGARALLTTLLTLATLVSCAEGPLEGAREAQVTMHFLTPATVRSLVVQVSGPGIDPPVIVNIPVGADSTAADTLELPAGSGRRFVVSAVDSAGVTTHRADTTITLEAGTNPPLAIRLDPLPSSLGVTITFGGVRLVVPDTSTRFLRPGDSVSIAAFAVRANGDTVPGDSLSWGALNPARATVSAGRVAAHRIGETSITASYAGATAVVGVRVVSSLLTRVDVSPVVGGYVAGDTGTFAFFPRSVAGGIATGPFGTTADGPELIGGPTECAPGGCLQRLEVRDVPDGTAPFARRMSVGDFITMGDFGVFIFTNVADSLAFALPATATVGAEFTFFPFLFFAGSSYHVTNTTLEIVTGAANVTRCVGGEGTVVAQAYCYQVTPTAAGELRLRVRLSKSDGGSWEGERAVTVGAP